MKTKYLFILILTLSFLTCSEAGFARQTNSNPSGNGIEKSELKLFNGKNLDGWYTFLRDKGRNNDPNKVFTVQKGLIRISGEEFGCITTHEEFENYAITVEFKWGDITFAPRADKARDSGLLLHSVGEDGGSAGIWMHSIECQIIEGGTGDILVVGDGTDDFSVTCTVGPEKQAGSYVFMPSGNPATINSGRINWYGRDPEWADKLGFRGRRDVEKKPGKWNRLEIVASGSDLVFTLNGKLVNRATAVRPTSGRIQIQSEGAEIFIRKMVISPLS
jgi:hypothetical protein